MKMLRIEAKKEVQDRINAKYASIRERRKGIKVRPNKLMILCLTFEFLNRWVVQAMDSRLASFLSNKFGFSSLSYSFLSCATGVVSCLQQAFLYGYIVRTRGVPIPYVAQFGIVLEMIGYLHSCGWDMPLQLQLLLRLLVRQMLLRYKERFSHGTILVSRSR